MNVEDFQKCATLIAFKETDNFDSVAKNKTEELNARIRVWYYSDSSECWEYNIKFIIKDYCVATLVTSNSSHKFNDYKLSNGGRSWQKENYEINFKYSFISKTLEESISEMNRRILENIDNNYSWSEDEFELVYQLC